MNIAVLMGGLLYDSQRNLIDGITDCAKEKKANVFVFTCGGDIYKVNNHNRGEFQIYQLPDLSAYDGIIIAPNTIQNIKVVNALEKKLKKLHIPTVAIDDEMHNIASFRVDNEKAMYDMAEHVINVHSRKKILYISGPKENLESNEREQGFLKSMQQHDMKKGEDFWVAYGNFWTNSGQDAMRQHRKAGLPIPEAVICANDYMAIGAIEELQTQGIRIPEDVVVTGFDNVTEARYHEPRITSIQKPIYKMGYAACEEIVRGGIKGENRMFEVTHRFAESCGCELPFKDNIKEFKRRVTKEKSDNIHWAEILNAMSADLNELNTLEEFIDKLKSYIVKMDFPYFYLCLCDEKQPLEEVEVKNGVYRMVSQKYENYTEYMQVAIAYTNGKFHAPERIETKNLLPDHFYKTAKDVVSVIMPLHFRLHNLGYCIVGGSSFPMETIQFQTWINSLGNGLENIRKQMLMQSMIDRLNKMWIYDTMTGVLNRAGFYRQADSVLAQCRKKKCNVLLLFVDIDKLKTVNDSYGHEEGDFYIKSVAQILQRHSGEDSIVMRYGGDEFVILHCLKEGDLPQKMIQTIKQEVKNVKEEQHKPYFMDVSIGHYIAEMNEQFRLEALIEHADKEMYIMKRNNRQER